MCFQSHRCRGCECSARGLPYYSYLTCSAPTSAKGSSIRQRRCQWTRSHLTPSVGRGQALAAHSAMRKYRHCASALQSLRVSYSPVCSRSRSPNIYLEGALTLILMQCVATCEGVHLRATTSGRIARAHGTAFPAHPSPDAIASVLCLYT